LQIRINVDIAKPAGVNFVGNCAEWIHERPSINGVAATLAPVREQVMRRCVVSTYDGTFAAGGDRIVPPPGGPPFDGICYEVAMNVGNKIVSRPALFEGSEDFKSCIAFMDMRD
jgi:hypothetical protein